MSLNPMRYRHVITTSILKQYMRENLFIGELEVENNQQQGKKMFNRIDEGPGQGGLGLGKHQLITALQDNQGKNMKKKSVQITNFFKSLRTASKDSSPTTASTRKFSKENLIQNLFKTSR
jgi:hypothetical protein